MLNKLDELRVRTQGYNVIGIVETWVQDQILDSELAILDITCTDWIGKGSGGGVILYVKDTLQSSLCTGMMDTGFEESIWCKVNYSKAVFWLDYVTEAHPAVPIMITPCLPC